MDHGRKCHIPGCTGKANTYSLPKEPNIRQAWLLFVYEKIPAKLDTQLHICSEHFTRDSFVNLGQFQAGFAKKLFLKRGAVPTVRSSQLQASTSTSQERQHTTDADCQTDAPSVASHGTQLSYMTLGPGLRSKGQPAYEMMETDPDWAPSLYLGHTEITCTNTAQSASQRKRDQRKTPLQPAEADEQHTVDETHEAEGGGAKSDDPLSPDWVPSIFTHTPAIKKRKGESYEQHNRMKSKWVEEKKKSDAMDVLLELSSEPDAELAPLEEEEQQCDNRLCKEKTERLQKECNELREENQRLRSSNVKWM